MTLAWFVFRRPKATILVAVATVGSAHEPAGSRQMASLWSFKALCHGAADARVRLDLRHAAQRPLEPAEGGWG